MNLLYVHSPELGYGRMGVMLAEAIERAGVEVFDDLPNPATSGATKFIPQSNNKSAVCGHVGWMSTPGHCRGLWRGQTSSMFTMFESSILPEPFRENLDIFDTIVVPSEQNRDLFSRYHKNVRFVPLGIDPKDWHLTDRPTMNEQFFTFLISGGGYRKGSDLVIAAFRKVFATWPNDMPIPRLLVHTARSFEVPSDDRIQLITGKLDPEEEKALYGIAHCFVYPSRGEGFGLRPLQAIAQGCPTIATDAHGHRAFSHLMTYRLGWTLQETPPMSFHHGPAGSWWEPDFDELCQAMEDVYYNYASALATAQECAYIASETMTWDESARKYLDAIGRENLELPDVTPTEWVIPELRRYLVRVNQPRMMEVGGVSYLMEPSRYEVCAADDEGAESIEDAYADLGEVPMRLAGATHVRLVPRDYWEPADVKRVLFESGALDLSCLPQNLDSALELGLSTEQYERIPAYTASQVACPTCHQKLNSHPFSLEELLALPMPVER